MISLMTKLHGDLFQKFLLSFFSYYPTSKFLNACYKTGSSDVVGVAKLAAFLGCLQNDPPVQLIHLCSVWNFLFDKRSHLKANYALSSTLVNFMLCSSNYAKYHTSSLNDHLSQQECCILQATGKLIDLRHK